MNKNWQIISFLRREAAVSPDFPPAIREARIFEHIMENLPLYYIDRDLLAGDFGWRRKDDGRLKRFFISAENQSAENSTYGTTPEEELRREFHCFGGFTPAHTCIDYEKLINLGVAGIIDEISVRRKKVYAQEENYLAAMEITMKALLKYTDRFACLLEKN